MDLFGPDASLSPVPADLPEVWKCDVVAEEHNNSCVSRQTEQFVRTLDNSRMPFFLYVSFPDPHHPFSPPLSCEAIRDVAIRSVAANWQSVLLPACRDERIAGVSTIPAPADWRVDGTMTEHISSDDSCHPTLRHVEMMTCLGRLPRPECG